AEHPAVRRGVVAHRHHAGHRRHHALCDVAAHAPARQEPEVGDRLPGRPRADDPRRAEVRLQLADPVRARGAAAYSRRQQDPRDRVLRQLAEEQVESGAGERSVLVGAELGRDVPAVHRVLGGQPDAQRDDGDQVAAEALIHTSAISLQQSAICTAVAVALAAATMAAQEDWHGVLHQHPAVGYIARPTTARIATLNQALANGARTLRRDVSTGYLEPVLDALGLSVDSQLL